MMPHTQTLSAVCHSIPGLTEAHVLAFMRDDWVRPAQLHGEPLFNDGDVARIQLIMDLRATMDVEAETLPILLSLLDQLYATRRQLRRVIDEADPALRDKLAVLLQG